MPSQLTGPDSGVRPRSFALAVSIALGITVFALAGCASLRSPGVRAGSESSDWSAVMRLDPGSSVRVEDAAGAAVAGRFVRADGDGVTLAVGPASQTVLRAAVQRLLLIERLTATKAKRAWLVGTVAGGLLGAFAAKSNRVPWALVMSAGWGAIGAVIGASDGFFDRKESLIYRAGLATGVNPTERQASIGLQPTTARWIMRPSRLKPGR